MTMSVKVALAAIQGKGRGVVAVAAIDSGELIDVAPTIALRSEDCDLVERTTVGDYYFAHPEDPEGGLVVLGLASLCNHADAPNAEIRWRRDPAAGLVAELLALRPIADGEEITRRYACMPWFQLAS